MPMLTACGRVATLLLVIALAACQTLGGAGPVTSTVTTDLTPVVADALASDMAGRLGEQIGPGSATIALGLDGSVFGRALEASLKDQGYAIVTDQEAGSTVTVPLAYVVDGLDDNVLVRLSTPGVELTRMYKVWASGAEPVSPLSVMTRGGEGTP